MFTTYPVLRGQEVLRVFLPKLEGLGWIAGGYARWCMSPAASPIKADDIDIVSKDEGSFNELRARFGVDNRVDDIFGDYIETENAITLNFHHPALPKLKVQLIRPVIGTGDVRAAAKIEDIICKFDLTVICAAVVDEASGIGHYCFADDERDGRLQLVHIGNPMDEVGRLIKYAAKGYTAIVPAEIVRIFDAWDHMTRSGQSKALADFVARPSGIPQS